jgi:hypothetical protein
MIATAAQATTIGPATFTASDEYETLLHAPDRPAPIANGTLEAAALLGPFDPVDGVLLHVAGFPAPLDGLHLLGAWEFRVDDPDSLDPLFAAADQQFDFEWSWQFLGDASIPGAGVIQDLPIQLTLKKRGTLTQLLPVPNPAWVEVTASLALLNDDGSDALVLPDFDAFALVGIDAPNTPGIFEVGFASVAAVFPGVVGELLGSGGIAIEYAAGSGSGALTATVVPEPATAAVLAVGAGAFRFIRVSRRAPRERHHDSA